MLASLRLKKRELRRIYLTNKYKLNVLMQVNNPLKAMINKVR